MSPYRLPLLIFVVLVVFLGIGLGLNPQEVPSPLVGRPAPQFRLKELHHPDRLFGPADLKGKVWILNVWASWCVSCRTEHPVLNAWSRKGELTLIGLNYKDESVDALNWLERLGDPYTLSVIDDEGKAGLDWGVYGVPESFVVDKKGIIRYKQIGPITMEAVESVLAPLIGQLQAESA
ncbi:MAG: DsbE family thiol:disulfide interchange protein [Methylococcaceae bacterium]|nr:DsbE family thiol:disulfide interchange protein [Methylococcaceae bacterium]